MLFFFDVRVNTKEMTIEQLWDIWEKEAEAARAAKEMFAALYKVVGQRRVIGVINVESHDQLDKVFMSVLPMAHYLEFFEISPVRDYWDFAEDVKRRWE